MPPSERQQAEEQDDSEGREGQEGAETDQTSGNSGGVHLDPRVHASRCMRRRSPSKALSSCGTTTPASPVLSGRPWSRFLFHTSALKETMPSVKSARDAGMPSRGIGKRSAWTPPPYMARHILSVENGTIGARSRRRSRRHAWSVHRAPVSPSYARAFTIST